MSIASKTVTLRSRPATLSGVSYAAAWVVALGAAIVVAPRASVWDLLAYAGVTIVAGAACGAVLAMSVSVVSSGRDQGRTSGRARILRRLGGLGLAAAPLGFLAIVVASCAHLVVASGGW